MLSEEDEELNRALQLSLQGRETLCTSKVKFTLFKKKKKNKSKFLYCGSTLSWSSYMYSVKVLYGETAQRSNPFPFYIPFSTEKTIFGILSFEKWHPFDIPTVKPL